MTYREVMPDGTVRLTGAASAGAQGPPGSAGPAGPAGPPGVATVVYTFGTPSTSWVCTHNLGRQVDVTVLDNNNLEIGGDVYHNSTNVVTITFFYPVSGSVVIQ